MSQTTEPSPRVPILSDDDATGAAGAADVAPPLADTGTGVTYAAPLPRRLPSLQSFRVVWPVAALCLLLAYNAAFTTGFFHLGSAGRPGCTGRPSTSSTGRP